MPRIKPPRTPAAPDLDDDLPIVIEDNTPPTEDIEIALAPEDDGGAEVELAPAPPADPAPEPPPAPPAPQPPGDDALVRAAEQARRAEELQRAAIRERDNAIRERDAERTSREEAEYNSVLTAITAEQSTLEKAEADYAALASAGDWAAAAKAQSQIAKATARLDRLEEGKAAFESRRQEQPAPAAQPAAAAPPTPPQDFESRVAALGVPDQAKAWLRSHPEFINDASKNQELGSAHNYIVGRKKIEPFSQAYFEALDTEFGFKAPPAAAPPEPEPAPQPPRRNSIPMTAPVSRDVPTPSGQRQPSNKITLTAEERQIARSSYTAPDMTNEQKELAYARNKQRLAQMRANGAYPQPERN